VKKTVFVLIVIFALGWGLWRWLPAKLMVPTESKVAQGVLEVEDAEDIEVVAENLTIPWEMEFLPNGEMIVTQRTGELLKVSADTKVIAKIEGVEHVGEGGLLGMALDPKFLNNQYIYLYLTTNTDEGLENRVERYQLINDRLVGRAVILEGIAGARFHDGGRIAFGPDGLLYVTTGDAGNENSAQDKNSLSGKILRIDLSTSSGLNKVEVYSFGHRNVQGLAWDERGQLWATEHGPSGTESGFDEVNLIVKDGNYGWPVVRGDQTREGMMLPKIQSGATETWAPAGAAYLDGKIFFVGLRGESLYEAKIGKDNSLSLKAHFREEFGRLRFVKVGPGGWLYLGTSNTDGRGEPKKGDDKIIRVNPEVLGD